MDPVGAADEEDGVGVVDALCLLPYRIVSFDLSLLTGAMPFVAQYRL